MSTREDSTMSTAPNGTTPCDCEGCRASDLPVNPFVALRVAYGMLLGEEDFRTLMGNPRGKQMLHSAWLHGSGVVWGYKVEVDGLRTLKIDEGLAIDGIGRELLNEATACLDIRDFIKDRPAGTLRACLIAELDSCPSDPVPTLADPCDVTRKHDDYSRVVEQVRFTLRFPPASESAGAACCPEPSRPYPRVRALLGLDPVDSLDSSDPESPGQAVMDARRAVSTAPPDGRSQELLKQFRKLAALDSMALEPAKETGDCYPTLFPRTEMDSAVVLACVELDVSDCDGTRVIGQVRIVDQEVRTALLPTATIQELTCGLAPALLGGEIEVDAGGPRVIGDGIVLVQEGQQLVIPVTAPLAEGSVPGTVQITSLPTSGTGGWVMEDVYDTRYDESQKAIVVRLADRPVNDLIRIVVKGTGARPVMGRTSAVPLAGLVGGPPGTRHDGHDAVWTFYKTVAGQGGPGPSEGAGQADTDNGKEAGR